MKDTQPKIVCDNISKTFIQKGTQVVPVLENISLEVRDQEFLVILGPGQCGKTTLLRILAGLETPSSGAAYLDGKQIVAPGPQIGLVFQSYKLFPWKTVRQNVEIGLEVRGLEPAKIREISNHYLGMTTSLPVAVLLGRPFLWGRDSRGQSGCEGACRWLLVEWLASVFRAGFVWDRVACTEYGAVWLVAKKSRCRELLGQGG